MKHFAFFPSHLEPGQVELGRRLEATGYRVFWIMLNTYDCHWLVRLGVLPERILNLTIRPTHHYSDAEVEAGLIRIEQGRPPFVNDIVEMDRRLRLKDDREARRFLVHCEARLTAFLTANQIEFVSNGRDTAPHLVCVKVCERLGLSAVVPTAVRYPDNCFGFCAGFRESEFLPLGRTEERHLAEAREILRVFRADKPVGEISLFERRNARFLRRMPQDLMRWGSLAYRASFDAGNDIGRYSVWQLLEMFMVRRARAFHVGLGGVFQSPPAGRPYVLYGMQMQPESSIDVLASFAADQRNLISLIAKSTPQPYEVLIKPHPDHVGGVARRELMAIRRIPGVTLIPPGMNSHDLIRRAAIVMTPAGSMAFEAGMFGVPAIVFADEFFKRLPGVHYCRYAAQLQELIPAILSSPAAPDDDGIVRFLADLLARSFKGRITNYLGPYTEREIDTYIEGYNAAFDYARRNAAPLPCGPQRLDAR